MHASPPNSIVTFRQAYLPACGQACLHQQDLLEEHAAQLDGGQLLLMAHSLVSGPTAKSLEALTINVKDATSVGPPLDDVGAHTDAHTHRVVGHGLQKQPE